MCPPPGWDRVKMACLLSVFAPCTAREFVGDDMEIDDSSENSEATHVVGQDPAAGVSSLPKHKKLYFGTQASIGKGKLSIDAFSNGGFGRGNPSKG